MWWEHATGSHAGCSRCYQKPDYTEPDGGQSSKQWLDLGNPGFTWWGLYREDSHQSNPTNFSGQHTVISISAGVLHISQLATAQPSQCSQWLWSRAESRQVLPRVKDKATSQDSTVWSGHWSRAKRTSPKCPYLFWESALIPLGFFAFLLVFCSMDFLLFPLPGVTVIITVNANMYSVLPLCQTLS